GPRGTPGWLSPPEDPRHQSRVAARARGALLRRAPALPAGPPVPAATGGPPALGCHLPLRRARASGEIRLQAHRRERGIGFGDLPRPRRPAPRDRASGGPLPSARPAGDAPASGRSVSPARRRTPGRAGAPAGAPHDARLEPRPA